MKLDANILFSIVDSTTQRTWDEEDEQEQEKRKQCHELLTPLHNISEKI